MNQSKKEKRICTFEACGRPHYAKGLCAAHYMRLLRYKDASVKHNPGVAAGTRPPLHERCSIEGCAGKPYAREFCGKHYRRFRIHGDPLAGKPSEGLITRAVRVWTCSVDGCDNHPVGGGLCGKHYFKQKKYGDPLGGKYIQDGRSKEWTIGKSGYIFRYDRESIHATKGGTVFQHRQIMGDLIGRRLTPGENVHHKNGNRADNNITNLELWVKGQPSGQRVQDMVKFAKKILEMYPEEVLAALGS